MVKAKSKKSVYEQMKKKIEDFGIFFELLWDRIRTPKGAIITAVLACLVISSGVLAVRACVGNRATNNSEPKTSTSKERRTNSNTKSSSGAGTDETKKTEESEDKNSPNGSNSAANRRSNRRANSESGSDGWVMIDDAVEGPANPAPVSSENNTTVEGSSGSEPAQEPTSDAGDSSGVSDNIVTEAPSTSDSELETPGEATEPTE